MPLFEIKKPIYTTLRINCNSFAEAKEWAEKIVATIEIDSFDGIPPSLELFEAESIQNELDVKKIEPNIKP